MKIVIAPNSFKGSMTSIAEAEAIRRGIHQINPSLKQSSSQWLMVVKVRSMP
ncbi:glycerate kinase [Rossellomorea aquimaris]|uniref:Glycerate kinase n=1 Tax=Rossellomorea aquimaris TaxID=189382 RepID=A0A5D4TDD4_9BACI|nr:glycerate kinase [Rossellomorea aquimaris]TYS72084.1 glycerate kinase [Rossellomorea aquimaris]TYS77222.1 glycerate kinase [Rossellomorea aquimaris]